MTPPDEPGSEGMAAAAASLRIDRSVPRRRRGGAAPWVLGLIVVAAAGLIAWTFLGKAAGVMGGREVREGRAVRASPDSASERTTASGYVVARTRAAISPKYPGRLLKLHVDVGDLVEKGQVLAEMDHAELDAALARAAAEVERAKAGADAAAKESAERSAAADRAARDLATAKAVHRETEVWKADAAREAERAERLFEEQVITRSERDRAVADGQARDAQEVRARAAVDSAEAERVRAERDAEAMAARIAAAKAGVAAAEAGLREAQARRADADIRADFRGRVLRKEAEVGEVIAPAVTGGGSTRGALLTLADFDTLELEVDVFERDVALVKEGSPCRIVLDAYPRDPFSGRVRQVVPTADRQKATVQVKVSFDRPDERVLPEMGGRAVFLSEGAKVSTEADRVVVPASAVATREGASGVWVLEKEGSDVRTRFVPVGTGDRAGESVVVTKGLAGGERIILDPPSGLKDGERVVPVARP